LEDHRLNIKYSVADEIATVELSRPQRRNSFTLEMVDRWAAAVEDAGRDPAVRAVIVTGGADAFCAGVDLDEFAALEDTPLSHKQTLTDRVHAVSRALARIDKPVVAAVNGVAVGAGMDMALMCDLRFAARSARFSEGYIRLGLVPGDGGCYLLPRLVGVAKALELLWSGEFVDAEEALRIGIVNRVYEDDELMERTREYLGNVLRAPSLPLGIIKRVTYQSSSMDLATSLDVISSHMAVVQSTDEARAALARMRQSVTRVAEVVPSQQLMQGDLAAFFGQFWCGDFATVGAAGVVGHDGSLDRFRGHLL
jgi:enoyl-CoA hydratase/carnithine racemase